MNAEYLFRLYVAGDAPNSARARDNLERIIGERPALAHKIEEIDILKDPKRALADKILVTPTLVKVSPGPERRIMGNLSERKKVLDALGLEDSGR